MSRALTIQFTIYAIAGFIIVLIVNLVRDLRYFYKNRATNHNNRFWIRLWCLFPSITLFTLAHTGWHILEWFALWQLILSSAMVGFTWLNLFDGPYNLFRNENWFYPGSNGPEDGVLENLLQRWPWLQIFKVAIAAGLILVYIIV